MGRINRWRMGVCLGLLVCGAAARVEAALITVNFAGLVQVGYSNALFAAGDTFSGSFTLNTAAPTFPHPNPTFEFQSIAITAWSFFVNSTVRAPFSITGSSGIVSLGNDTAFGDRYNVRFDGGATPVGTLQFIQLQLSASGPAPSMLTGDDLSALPNLALADDTTGRFFVTAAGGCEQCFISLTSFAPATTVPEPATITLIGAGVVSLIAGIRRRRAV